MKAREHESILRELKRRHAEELKRAAAFWQGEAERLQEVADIYAQAMDEQDARIAELEAKWESREGKAVLPPRDPRGTPV